MLKKGNVFIFCMFLIGVPSVCQAQEETPILLEHARISTHDIQSIKRGAKAFAATCMVCHSLEYLAHDPIAKAAGITLNKMPKKDQKWWFGAAPPDLSVIAKVRSPDWLYTYLHVFYKDPARKTGTNNLLVDNVNMPNPFIGMQGEQELIVVKGDLFKERNIFTRKEHYYTVLNLKQGGGMPPDDFDKMVRDLVNFLVYASDPKHLLRERIGAWVLIFVAILFVLMYLLKREYWKKVK